MRAVDFPISFQTSTEHPERLSQTRAVSAAGQGSAWLRARGLPCSRCDLFLVVFLFAGSLVGFDLAFHSLGSGLVT